MFKTTTFRRNGTTKTVPNGFSATVFLLGFMPCMVRNQWGYMWLTILSDVVALILSGWVFNGQDAFGSLVVLRFGMAIFRNQALADMLKADGWKPEPQYYNFLAANDEEV